MSLNPQDAMFTINIQLLLSILNWIFLHPNLNKSACTLRILIEILTKSAHLVQTAPVEQSDLGLHFLFLSKNLR